MHTNAWIVIRNFRKHSEVVFHCQRHIYFIKNVAWLEHLRVKVHLPPTMFDMLLYTMSKMVRECVDYASNHKKMIFEINFDYFRLISRKCASIIPMIDYYFLCDFPSLVKCKLELKKMNRPLQILCERFF
jgi:hypothetical protein